jgi:hypothetical protein
MSETRETQAQQLSFDFGTIERLLESLPNFPNGTQQTAILDQINAKIRVCSPIIAFVTTPSTSERQALFGQWVLFKEQFERHNYGGCIGIIIVCKRHAETISHGT